jgi:hypothetical protein
LRGFGLTATSSGGGGVPVRGVGGGLPVRPLLTPGGVCPPPCRGRRVRDLSRNRQARVWAYARRPPPRPSPAAREREHFSAASRLSRDAEALAAVSWGCPPRLRGEGARSAGRGPPHVGERQSPLVAPKVSYPPPPERGRTDRPKRSGEGAPAPGRPHSKSSSPPGCFGGRTGAPRRQEGGPREPADRTKVLLPSSPGTGEDRRPKASGEGPPAPGHSRSAPLPRQTLVNTGGSIAR